MFDNNNISSLDPKTLTNYLESYLDCTENLPSEIQRFITQFRELDLQTNENLWEIDHLEESFAKAVDTLQRKQVLNQLQRCLIREKELGDQKLEILSKIIEDIENKSRQLEINYQILDPNHQAYISSMKEDDNLSTNSLLLSSAQQQKENLPGIAGLNSKVISDTLQSSTNVVTKGNNSSSKQQQNILEEKEEIFIGKSAAGGGGGGKRNRRNRTAANINVNYNNSNITGVVNNSNAAAMNQVESMFLATATEIKEEEVVATTNSSSLNKKTQLVFKDEDDVKPKKKKNKKEKLTVEKSPSAIKIIGNIDPNEPVYCLCREVSYGEMIGCDNEGCSIEWYHFTCVGLTYKPKGKWYCPSCRGDRPNMLSPELVEMQRKSKKNSSNNNSGLISNSSNISSMLNE